jgi:hypothetical protein
MTLLGLPKDILRDIASFGLPIDRIVLTHTCKSLRDTVRGQELSREVCRDATDSSLGVLKWTQLVGYPIDARVCAAAARGDLQSVAYLVGVGCPLTAEVPLKKTSEGIERLKKELEKKRAWEYHSMESAARSGQLDMVEYLVDLGCPTGYSSAYAAAGGHLDIIEYLFSINPSRYEFSGKKEIDRDGIIFGRMLGDTERPIDPEYDPVSIDCAFAAASGQLHVIGWFHSMKLCDYFTVCKYAGGCGYIEILEWVFNALEPHERRIPLDEAMYMASRRGHLEVLRWGYEHRWRPDPLITLGAATGGHIEILNWAREIGAPFIMSVCMDQGTDECKKWLQENM